MAKVELTYRDAPWPGGTSAAASATLGTVVAANTETSGHVDLTGYVSKIVVTAVNGATNSADVKLQGSHDGTNWFDIYFRANPAATYAATATTLTAGSTGYLFPSPTDRPRYLRGKTGTNGNANGTTFYIDAER